MAKWFVAGGAGFLGSHIIERLVSMNQEVTVCDVAYPGTSRISDLLSQITYVRKSVHDLGSAEAAEELRNSEFAVYAAAQADVSLGLSSPYYTFDLNVMALVQFLEALRGKTDLRLVFMSTDAAYGKVPEDHMPIVEEEPFRPFNPYGASKAAADLVCQCYAEAYGMDLVILRSGSIFGPGMRPDQALQIFVRQALRDEPISIHGDGSQRRDLNYVSNVVDAIMAASSKRPKSIVYNIASGKLVSVREMATRVIEQIRSGSRLKFLPKKPRGGNDLVLSIDRARKELGYKPEVSFEEGLTRTVEEALHHKRAPES